ncbi:MAG TPA: amylo-alpha-1,6-glucosidase [Steroidobacteraceae bacterium]|nr:amylo-alpha-1,6-glucosidase [Steroidobacteraceae bacterium]
MTNGLGGYACGTVALANTRRYHAFLMASLAPPVQRTLLVAKIDLSVEYLGQKTDLTANEFSGGAISPQGFVHLESFAVIEGVPTWRFAVADAQLELQIFMAQGANTSYLRLELLRNTAPMRVTLKPYVAYRDYHSHCHGEQPFELTSAADQCCIRAVPSGRPFRLLVTQGEFAASPTWYWNFWHREEALRGLDASEDLFFPGSFSAEIETRVPLDLIATAETSAPAAGSEVLKSIQNDSKILAARLPKSAPAWIRALARASDQFIVRRGVGGTAAGAGGAAAAASIIAGYPWFADWGRDTMISLPGLATAVGRYDIAANILKTYAAFVDRGMLPNRFPDGGEAPEYNTADATLWMFHALEDYLQAKPSPELLAHLFPSLVSIIHAHVDGTRYGIQVDAHDGLLHVGEAGTQLTWMDAKHGDEVFTPRIGKPVEINALWLNALNVMIRSASRVHNLGEKRFCETLLDRASASFGRFWNEERQCLYDVIDVDGTGALDASIRPNQLLAISLPYCALPAAQMRAVVERCGRDLLTSYGLRSLSADDPKYRGSYAGDPKARDAAYHMGTVWAWLLGPFARAHFRVYGDARLAQSLLDPIAQHVSSACVGSVSEIFDGDAPHTARGCFAQAWSVAEILRSWIYLERKISKT